MMKKIYSSDWEHCPLLLIEPLLAQTQKVKVCESYFFIHIMFFLIKSYRIYIIQWTKF